MAELPDDYLQFQVMIAVPETISVHEFADIFTNLSKDIHLHWASPEHSPHVMAVRTKYGDLVGAITRVKGGD